MVQNPNQFAQTQERGYTDLQAGAHNVFSCQVDATETGTLNPGDPVTVVNSLGGVPKVIKATADTSEIFGFVDLNLKDANYSAGDRIEIAIKGTVMFLEAGAAIARGVQVEADVSEDTVITAAGTNTVVGWAFDGAAADGDLLRVYIETPYAAANA